jgi:hypothetical protein
MGSFKELASQYGKTCYNYYHCGGNYIEIYRLLFIFSFIQYNSGFPYVRLFIDRIFLQE